MELSLLGKTLYLSGPMTGKADHNIPAFIAETARLRSLGYRVVSPHEINTDTSRVWHDCLRADIRALCDCHALALMPGWEHSAGAHLELHIAHRLAMDIYISKDLT
jgi:hypothetical protein